MFPSANDSGGRNLTQNFLLKSAGPCSGQSLLEEGFWPAGMQKEGRGWLGGPGCCWGRVVVPVGSPYFLTSANSSCAGFCSPGYQAGSEMERWGEGRLKFAIAQAAPVGPQRCWYVQ